jgi:hypothetical protein
MIVVALVAWMNFWPSPYKHVAASVVTAFVIVVAAFWFNSISRKWMSFLLMSNSRILTQGVSQSMSLGGVKKDAGSRERNKCGNDGVGSVLDQAAT